MSNNSDQRRSDRIGQQTRIDYQILNKTGNKVEKHTSAQPQLNQQENNIKPSVLSRSVEELAVLDLSQQLNQLQLQDMPKDNATETNLEENTANVSWDVISQDTRLSLIIDEIDDFIDENPVNHTIIDAGDTDECITKISQFRSEFRVIIKDLSNNLSSTDFERLYSEKSTQVLANIKEYIIHAKERKSEIRKSEKNLVATENEIKMKKTAEESSQKKQAANFLINEVIRITKELNSEFSKDSGSEVSDEEISRRKENLSANMLKLDQLSTKFQRCLEIIPDDYSNKETIIINLTENYDALVKEKENYEEFIDKEIKDREISKEKTFQISSLNINLAKFKGYDSELDIYSFQFEFEKLHLKSTPKKMLPDLLKYNYLSDPALSLVKSLDNIDEMWCRLKKAYGDPKTLLTKKLTSVRKVGPLWKVSGERLKESLMSLINGMLDLISLSKYHGIEGKLYHGEGLEIIYGLMGETRVTKWISQICDEKLEEEQLWKRLIAFLEKEMKVQQELSLIKKQFTNEQRAQNNTYSTSTESYEPSHGQTECHTSTTSTDSRKCSFCNEMGHYVSKSVKGNETIQYYSCKKIVQMSPLERFNELRRLGFCYMCLYPGAHQNSTWHSNGSCRNDFSCKHPSHDRYDRRKHILVCHEHRDTEENQKILQTYKEKFILQRSDIPEFSKNIKLSFISKQAFVTSPKKHEKQLNDDPIISENGIYMLQTIQVDNQEFTLFFDTGCSDMVSRYEAIQRIGDRAKLEVQGPISLGGVGDLKTQSQYGIYQVRLPLVNGSNAVLAGVCLETITNKFPMYPLEGKIKDDIFEEYEKIGKNSSDLPKLPAVIGGNVDFMIGTKYLRYHPEPIFTLPSGLTIYKSPFGTAEDPQGVIGGPHAVITEIDKAHHNGNSCQHAYLTNQYKLYQAGYKIDPDAHLLGIKYNKDFKFEVANNIQSCNTNNGHESQECSSCYLFSTNTQKYYEEVENAASEILYRCINCRKCQKCRNGEKIEYISIKEEIEQDLINQSITIDTNACQTTAKLPLLEDPVMKLAPNKNKALAIYNSQVRRLSNHPRDKDDVIASESKLQDLGHVDYVRNLTKEQQLKLAQNPVQNFIPWAAIWKVNSISTPCRIVFNASMPTESKVSLNDILAKGKNNMNMLVEIMIRWRCQVYAFHTDVQKMYNTVQLHENDWCLQRYIWQEDLDPRCIPEEKVIETLIYGVKSSGNQAERGLRMTADVSKEEYPEVNEIVKNDIYVDDCMSGEKTQELCFQRADQLAIVLMKGGFCLKGFTFSYCEPPRELSEDGNSVNVAGIKWFSKQDYLKLDISPLDFTKQRKRKQSSRSSEIPEKFTRRQCLSKVAEIFDLTGMLTPITAAMKLDLHTLVQRRLNWEDFIPDDLKHVWHSNFEMIKELPSLQFQRAVIPEDALNLDIQTLECADASKSLVCAAIYVRIKRKCGNYSCQLVFSRSKLVPDGMSIPRAELLAANVNAHTGEVVKRALRRYHKDSLKLTDSQVTLHWLNNQEIQLKQWVRNRVVEVMRFTEPSDWSYVRGTDMPADLGTRKGATMEDVAADSVWQTGFEWMKKDKSSFPIKSYGDIKVQCKEASEKSNEEIQKLQSAHLSDMQKSTIQYYEYSKYLIDPNRFRFRKVVRILAIVKLFIKKCKQRRNQPNEIENCKTFVKISDQEYYDASMYFFQKASEEVKKFTAKEKYNKISTETNGILYYTGRILSTQKVTFVESFSDTMRDLSSTSFHVPIIDRHSPLAYSIVNEIHWHHDVAKHSGVESTLRYVLQHAYIIEGRELVKCIRKTCIRCKILLKRTLNVSMGPVSEYNLTVAPAFYVCQTDIVGPFKAYSFHNKRCTLKIYFIVFCCTTTSTTSIKVMEDYSTASFIQAFIRLACEVGYPKILLIDEGSQLVKGCESMMFSFRDAQQKLHIDNQVEFQTCPVGGHNMHGKVERKIRSIQESINKSLHNERLSVLQWETMVCQISNSINDLPLASECASSACEYSDLITPNRLKLGRNNNRSPYEPMQVTSDPTRFMELNKKVFNIWFQVWLISHVPKLMHHPKWYDNDRHLKKGDIVLFLKSEKELCNSYQYGIVERANSGIDGKVRSAEIRYQNSNEDINRITHRATRQLVKIHAVDDLDIIKELGEIATYMDMKYKLEHQSQ